MNHEKNIKNVGCGSGTGDEDKDVTLTQFLSTGSTAERGRFDALVQGYYEQTGVRVNIIEVPSGDRETKIQSMLLSDEPIHLAKTTGVDLTFIDRILPLTISMKNLIFMKVMPITSMREKKWSES